MMELRVIGSGSSGNAYVLLSGQAALLIECGLPYRTSILPAIGFDRHKVQGCVVSHQHKDHAGYLAHLLGDAVDCYMPAELQGKYSRSLYAHHAAPNEVIKIGDFAVFAFECVHDCECNGYVIAHPEMGVCLFATDTGYIPADFSRVAFSQIMIEANYSEEIMRQRMEEDAANVPHYKHIMRGHMSLESVIDYLSKLNLSKCENIVLLHLSDDNSNEADFVAKVQKAFPLVRVSAAKADMEIKFDKHPY